MVSTRTSRASLKDLRRASEIVRILIAHGFGYLISKPALEELEVKEGDPQPQVRELPRPERLRRALEALGPTFVKAGQILSTRADIVPDEFAEALKKLQDHADPLPFETVKQVIEDQLKKPLGELFERFDEEPLATASIAQVHRAQVQREGAPLEVVCKVQRPGIRETMTSDLSLLYWLGRVLEGTFEEISAYSPTAIVEQFEQAVGEELDFVHERKNLERARRNFSSRPDLLVVPEAIAELSTDRVLTMEYLDGIKVTDVKQDPGFDREKLKNRLIETAFKQVFEDGYFHGDPHPGNVFVLGDGRLGLLDHGLWGHISAEQRDSLVQWLTAIALKSPSTLARLTLKIGEVPPSFDRMAYERDVRILMDKYIGVELSDLSTSGVIADSVVAIRKHRIKMPPDFAILARATATLEGIVRDLYPELDFQAEIQPYVQRLILQRLDFTRAGPEAMSLLLGLQSFTTEVPSQINQLLNDLSAGRFEVGLKGEALDELSTVGRIHSVRTLLGILCAALILAAGVSLAPFQYTVTSYDLPLVPLLALVFALFAMWGLTLTFLFPKGPQKIRLSRLLFWRRR